MRLWLLLSLCMIPCLPAVARDLTVAATWDAPATSATDPSSATEIVTAVRLGDGSLGAVFRASVAAGVTTLDQVLTDLPRQATSLQVALMDGTRILAQTAPAPLERTETALSLTLSPVLALSLQTLFDCGEVGVATLTTRGQVTRLSLTRAGTEVARLLSSNGPLSAPDGTSARVDGMTLHLALPDGAQVVCPALPAPPVLPVTARAQDDTWTIALDATQALITLPPGTLAEGEAIAPVGAGQVAGGAIVFDSPQFNLTLRAVRCLRGTDTVPYPLSARLSLPQGPASEGCAGSPLDLLVGQAWSVTTLLGIPVTQDLTLGFGPAQVTGRGTCNRYQANVTFEAGHMALRDLGTTRVACPTALRNLELRFLDALENANGFELGADGTLILRAGPMPLLTARQRSVLP
jgi:heat shock protein HslJ